MPPVVPPRWVCCTLVCFLTRFTPSTITRSDSGSTEMTLPSRPLALPAITRTTSPFLMCRELLAISEHLRSERDDLHEALLAQLPADRAEDTRATRLAVVLQDHRGVLVEADVGTVGTPALLGGHRPRLHQEDAVADAAGVLLVMGLELAAAPDDLAVQRVLDAVLDLDGDRLVHLVAHHQALTGLAAAARLAGHGAVLRSVLGHALLPASASSRFSSAGLSTASTSSVMPRARSVRT